MEYQNRFLNAITELSLNERCLIMLLAPIVRQKTEENPETRDFCINIKDFVEYYGIKSKTSYDELAKVAAGLLGKAFFYWELKQGHKIKVGVSWVDSYECLEHTGELKFYLNDDVIKMLSMFDKHNPFSKIEPQVITNLGNYGLVLYLLLSNYIHQNINKIKYSVDFSRERFDCVDKYPVFTDFKRYVLMTAIKDVETHTNLRINMKPVRTGRVITDVSFEFHQSQKAKTR